MLFYIPDPAFWDDPGPFPYSKIARRFAGVRFPVRPGWIDQYRLYHRRLEREREEWENYMAQRAEYERLMMEYQEQGEHMAQMLPIYLHHLGLSYKRTVQDRKHEGRFFERIDYCEIAGWHFDENAYYFNIVTWPLPPLVTIKQFAPGDDKADTAQTLSANFGSKVVIEFNPRGHDRPGLWIIVEHKAGRGQIPANVSYQQCLTEMPKSSGPLAIPVGHGAHGRSYIIDLSLITNLLTGGTQGGGKSNLLNAILSTLITRNSPQDLRLFLVDFKRVEFAFYKGIKHLGGDVPFLEKKILDKQGNEHRIVSRTVAPDYQPKEGEVLRAPMGRRVVTEPDELIPLLDYVIQEIERRTSLFEGKVRNIKSWNKRFPKRKLPYWFIVIDELADVMLQPKFGGKVEERLVRIAQKGRAEGIGLVLCTQTPSNKVVSMLIQQNVPTRVVFYCGTGHASGTMLDGGYEASYLPRVPGRALVREGQILTEVQTPQISDWTVRAAVRAAQQATTAVPQSEINRYPHIDPEKVFRYALTDLQRYCPMDDIYQAFKNAGVPREEIINILQDHQVQGDSVDNLAPAIEIDDEIYYLAPSPGGRVARQLIPLAQFEAEFETKWKAILAFRAPGFQKNGKTVAGQNQKTGEAGQTDQPADLDSYYADLEAKAIAPASANGDSADTPPDPDGPTADSANSPAAPIGSLVYKPTFNKTRSVRFLSVRKWRTGTKDLDLQLFKAAKEACNPELVETISREICDVLAQFFGRFDGAYVTTPPPGLSAHLGLPHFATLLGQQIALNLELEFRPVFAPRPHSDSSTPRIYDRRGDLVFLAEPAGPCILVDDVATSGTTIEECSNQLKAFGQVTPVVWLYGKVK